MKKVLFIFIILCVSTSNIQARKYTKTLRKSFSKTEQKEISRILFYVDSIVVTNCPGKSVDDAYHHYLDSIYTQSENGKGRTIAFPNKQKMDFLYALDQQFVRTIWRFPDQKVFLGGSGYETWKESVDFCPGGKYKRYIQTLAEKNSFYPGLLQSAEIAGGLSPVFVTMLLMENKNFDFTNTDNRFWAAVVLLTISRTA